LPSETKRSHPRGCECSRSGWVSNGEAAPC